MHLKTLPIAALGLSMWMIAAPAATPGGTTPARDLAEVLDEVTVWAKVPLKIEDFVARAMVDNVVLSPGGTRLLVAHMEKATATTTRTPDGVSIRLPTLAGRIPQISLLDFPSMQTVSRQQFPIALGGFSDIRWVNEEQFLLQTDVPARGFSSRRISTGALHAVDVKRAAYIPVSTDPDGLIRNNLPVDLRRWFGVFTSDADGPLRIVAARTGTSHQVLIQTTHDQQDGRRHKYGAFEMDISMEQAERTGRHPGAARSSDPANSRLEDGPLLRRVASLPLAGGQFITGAGHHVTLVTGLSARNERLVYYLPPDVRAQERANPRVEPAEPTELAQLLEQLLDASVEFILVGGGAAVIHGAPVTTRDIDIVYSREFSNVDRLLHVLSRLEARVVDPAGRDLKPEHAALSGTGQLLLRTRHARDRRAQGQGGELRGHPALHHLSVRAARAHRLPHCLAGHVVLHAALAGGVRVSG